MNIRRPNTRLSRQGGLIIVIFAAVLIVMIGFMGLAIDASRVYNRKVELNSFANVAALAAAKHLNGTSDGVDSALTAAKLAVADSKYAYGKYPIPWNDAYVSFGTSTSGSGWQDAAGAKLSPGEARYVKVDTSAGSASIGSLQTFFMKIVSAKHTTVTASASAVAGRSDVNVIPLALCALAPSAAASRPPRGELVEYGFRRGVGYDLMQLNPNGSSPANFVINPIDPGDKAGKPANASATTLNPFICSGKMPMRQLVGNNVLVSSPIPLASLYQQLNSRFDQYSGGQCNFRSAPPDANIKSYTYNSGVNWMKVTPALQSAASATVGSGRATIAELASTPTADPAQLGPLWSYAKPVPYTEYSAGRPEPAAGYTPFAQSEWPSLYASALPEPKSNYPASVPYAASGGANFSAPGITRGVGIRNRRVLHVALLECPVIVGTNVPAKVLAIGRFFMTVPATSTSIRAEFAGIADEGSLGGSVELYQ